MDIRQLDTNFVQKGAENVNYKLHSITADILEGFLWKNENSDIFCRLPEKIFSELNQDGKERLVELAHRTPGGALHFKTDSKHLMLKVQYRIIDLLKHMPITGTAGFDVCVAESGKERFLRNLSPEVDTADKETEFEFSCELYGGMKEYKIYFPLYSGITQLYVGLDENSDILPPPKYPIEKPIAFYGSSITHGGCVSRPSNSYCAAVARKIGAECINLGFSGNAKGEVCVAREIAKKDLCCFVYDYDYNAPTPQYLSETHEPFFKEIRKYNPELPVVMVSRPYADTDKYDDALQRKQIILNTYHNAVASGDKNVYFADGMRFFDNVERESATVDLCHPNDLGFLLMARGIYPIVKEAIEKK